MAVPLLVLPALKSALTVFSKGDLKSVTEPNNLTARRRNSHPSWIAPPWGHLLARAV